MAPVCLAPAVRVAPVRHGRYGFMVAVAVEALTTEQLALEVQAVVATAAFGLTMVRNKLQQQVLQTQVEAVVAADFKLVLMADQDLSLFVMLAHSVALVALFSRLVALHITFFIQQQHTLHDKRP